MANRYKEGTTVFSIYGGIFTYIGQAANGKHELADTLDGEILELSAEEFDKSRTVAWGRKRSI